jgi:hypothetical protein
VRTKLVILGNHHDAWGFGSIDPLSIFVDRYVILGNHHDAWVFGSIDPLSIFVDRYQYNITIYKNR